MKRLNQYWQGFRQRFREPGRKKKTYVFLVCLVCSAFFWLFIKLSREAQMVFERPLQIVNESPERVVSQQSSSLVQFNVRTTGARLLFSRFFISDDTLRINADKFGKVTREGEQWYYLSPGELRSRLSENLDATSQLLGIWPDTVFVKLAYAAEKKLPVQLMASYTFERRFGQYGPVLLEPDSVTVRGPRQLIDTLQAIPTEPLVFENLAETVQQSVLLLNPADDLGLTLEMNQAELLIPVEEFTEKLIEVNISVVCPQGEKEGYDQLRLFPNRVTVTCLVSLKDYSRVDPSQFVAHVNCPGEDSPAADRLEVFVDTFPDFVTIQSIRPATVEFLILE